MVEEAAVEVEEVSKTLRDKTQHLLQVSVAVAADAVVVVGSVAEAVDEVVLAEEVVVAPPAVAAAEVIYRRV